MILVGAAFTIRLQPNGVEEPIVALLADGPDRSRLNLLIILDVPQELDTSALRTEGCQGWR